MDFPTRQELAQADDLTLVKQMRQQNGEALAAVVDRYTKKVFSIAVKILKDEGEAEDIVQDVFLEIFRKIHLLEDCTLNVFVYRYALTRTLNRKEYLKCRHFYSLVNLDELVTGEDGSKDSGYVPEALKQQHHARIVEAKRHIAIARRTLRELKPEDRKIISLVLRGFTLPEAAERLALPVSHVKTVYYRSLEKMKAKLTKVPRWQLWNRAVELFERKVTVREVAKQLGIAKSVAGRYRKKWRAGEYAENT